MPDGKQAPCPLTIKNIEEVYLIMQLSACTSDLAKAGADCLTIFVDHDSNLVSEYSAQLTPLFSSGKALNMLDKSTNSSLLVPLENDAPANSALLWRLPKSDSSSQQWRDFAGKLATRLVALNSESVAIDLSGLTGITGELDIAEEIALSLEQSQYRYEEFKSKKKPARKLTKVLFATTADKDPGLSIQRGEAIGQGINLSRDLGNKPGNACTPTYLAELAVEM
ncbi:MAG: M17 family peptidase N-terminal domain-containing protein, partial [Pseudomonadales bacterium]